MSIELKRYSYVRTAGEKPPQQVFFDGRLVGAGVVEEDRDGRFVGVTTMSDLHGPRRWEVLRAGGNLEVVEVPIS